MRFSELWARMRRGFQAATQDVSAWDDRWYMPYGHQSAAGVRVSPDLALTLASVYACVRVVSETVASLPLIIYRRLPDGGKERAREHPLYRVLHDKPNDIQQSFQWMQTICTHLELRGNAYSLIQSGPDGPISKLIPIHPDRVTVQRLDNGRLRYEVRLQNGTPKFFNQEEIFHVRGQSLDGIRGMSTISFGAEVIGAGLAQQDYSARFWANDSKPSGILEYPQKLSPEGYVRLKESFQESQTGANRHKVAILEEGGKYAPVSITNKDSQFLETLQARRGEVCSLFRVPPHKIGDLTRATFSNIEQQNIEFATDSIRPRLVNIERQVNADLIDPLNFGGEDEYFCEFNMEALLRGDLKSRYEAYALAIVNGWMSPNDARRNENMNPIADGDIYIRQMNTVPLGTDPPQTVDQGGQEDDTAVAAKGKGRLLLADGRKTLAASRAKLMIDSAAERIVRKEVKALQKISERVNGHPPTEEVAEFYKEHTEFISETLRVSPTAAKLYTDLNERFFADNDLSSLIARVEGEGAAFLSAIAGGYAIQ